MKVYKLYPLGFAANSYLITADGKRAVAIDPAQPRILEYAQKLNLTVEYALFTHGHFDHIGGAAILQQHGAKIGCFAAEKELALFDNLGEEFGGFTVPAFGVDLTFSDGDTLDLCGLKLKAIATPGHTAGGASYLVENALFTGDTLFADGIGRCDLPTGSGAELENSVQKLYALDGDYTVYAGHGEDTTLSHERKHNAYIRQK